jgi:glycosyltransferase involved in cell wall biosynthesis
MKSATAEWSVFIPAANEERRLAACLGALQIACAGTAVSVCIIINGSTDRTEAIARDFAARTTIPIEVYRVAHACKSNAMNLYVHDLRPNATIHFFIDATTFVQPAAFRELARELSQRPDVLAASGLPLNGRGAQVMRQSAMRESKLFGQMFAVRNTFLDQLATLGRRIPIGLYRCDGLFSGFMCYETNGVAHRMPVQRVMTVPSAEWTIREISTLSRRDLTRGFNRLVRQARGRLENQAWNTIIWEQGFGALPKFADEMLLQWLENAKPKSEPLPDQIFSWLALQQVRRWRRPSEEALRPIQVV